MPKAKQIRLIIADDHEIFRNGLRGYIETDEHIVLVGEASSGTELLELTGELKPDVILTDIKMPGLTGMEATRIICKKYPDIGVIALSTFNDEYFINDILEAGGLGYLLKDASREEIIGAIYAANSRKQYFCHSTKARIAAMGSADVNSITSLTNVSFSEREKEIIRLICMEYSTKDISKKLFISKRTVDGHRQRIMRKIDAQNIIGVVTFAMRYGIYEP